MSNSTNTDGTNQSGDTGANGEGAMTIEQALEKIKSLETNFHDAVSERDKTKSKLRKLEDTASSAVELQKQYETLFAEKNKLFEANELTSKELNDLKTQIRDEKVTSVLETAFSEAGAKSISTIMKLVDKSKIQFDEKGILKAESISEIVKSLVESDPILFGEEDPKKGQSAENPGLVNPGVKRAGDSGSTEDVFTKEIKSAKTQKEIESVLRKYGKIT